MLQERYSDTAGNIPRALMMSLYKHISQSKKTKTKGYSQLDFLKPINLNKNEFDRASFALRSFFFFFKSGFLLPFSGLQMSFHQDRVGGPKRYTNAHPFLPSAHLPALLSVSDLLLQLQIECSLA